MPDQPITLDDVKLLDVQPGDTLVFRIDGHLAMVEHEQVRELIRRLYGPRLPEATP